MEQKSIELDKANQSLKDMEQKVFLLEENNEELNYQLSVSRTTTETYKTQLNAVYIKNKEISKLF